MTWYNPSTKQLEGYTFACYLGMMKIAEDMGVSELLFAVQIVEAAAPPAAGAFSRDGVPAKTRPYDGRKVAALTRTGLAQVDLEQGTASYVTDDTAHDVVLFEWPAGPFTKAGEKVIAVLKAAHTAAQDHGLDIIDWDTAWEDGGVPPAAFKWVGGGDKLVTPIKKESDIAATRMTAELRNDDYAAAIRIAWPEGSIPRDRPGPPIFFPAYDLNPQVYPAVYVEKPEVKETKGGKAARERQYTRSHVYAALRFMAKTHWEVSTEPVGDTPKHPVSP